MKHFLPMLALCLLPFVCVAQSERAADRFNQRGVRLFDQGDLDGAIAEFDHLLETVSLIGSQTNTTTTIAIIDPRAAYAYSKRGVARYLKGELDEARADFDKALRINPRLPEVWYNRAVVRQKQNDFAGALTDYTQAVNRHPQYEKALFARGELYLIQRSYEAAHADFTAVIRLNPRDGSAYNNRGMALYGLGQTAGALKDFSQAIALEAVPRHLAAAYRNRGKIRLDNGELNLAIADFTAAIEHYPTLALAYANRGIAYLRQGELTAADQDFARCLQLDSSLATALQEAIHKVKEQPKHQQ